MVGERRVDAGTAATDSTLRFGFLLLLWFGRSLEGDTGPCRRNYDDVSEPNVDNKQVKGQMSLVNTKTDPSTEIIKEIMGKMLLKYETYARDERPMRSC